MEGEKGIPANPADWGTCRRCALWSEKTLRFIDSYDRTPKVNICRRVEWRPRHTPWENLAARRSNVTDSRNIRVCGF